MRLRAAGPALLLCRVARRTVAAAAANIRDQRHLVRLGLRSDEELPARATTQEGLEEDTPSFSSLLLRCRRRRYNHHHHHY